MSASVSVLRRHLPRQKSPLSCTGQPLSLHIRRSSAACSVCIVFTARKRRGRCAPVQGYVPGSEFGNYVYQVYQ